MSRRELIPEMFARISGLEKLDVLKAECLKMDIGHFESLIHLAEKNNALLFAACLCECYADIQLNESYRANQKIIFYYTQSSKYFFRSGCGFEGSRVQQKINNLNTNAMLTQPHRGALFVCGSSKASTTNTAKKEGETYTHNPYAPVFRKKW